MANLVANATCFFTLEFQKRWWFLSFLNSSYLSLWIIYIFPLHGLTLHISSGKFIWYNLYAIRTNIFGTTITWKNWSHHIFSVNINWQYAVEQITDISRLVPLFITSNHNYVGFTSLLCSSEVVLNPEHGIVLTSK